MGLLLLYQEDMFTASGHIYDKAGLRHARRNTTYLHDPIAFNFCVRSWCLAVPNTDYAHKNITSNFSQARSTLHVDGS